MSYPTLEQFNEALQNPKIALVDPELKKGVISTTNLSLPLALCGGFALTYTIKTGGKKFAVRCFHKQSNALEQRYIAISNRLKSLHSPYFLDFEFQPLGVNVNGKVFPIVKMEWASGDTLGNFLEVHYRNKSELLQLNSSLRTLSNYLKGQNLAHGDVQPGNVMVSNGGQSVQLIDYDGMFVEDLRSLGSAELGQRNFQHPKRIPSSWDPGLDRFSFILLNLTLRVLEAYPDLWSKTQSDSDAILFKVNDFVDPDRSFIFGDLFGRPQFAEDARNFAAICISPFDKIPTLEDFLSRRNIPHVTITVSPIPPPKSPQYMGAFPVLDATNYELCLQNVGDRIELIGKIVEVKQNKTRYGKNYIFINFGPWKGKIVKVSIWSEGLDELTQIPDQTWIGKWISVVGLMEPPYHSRRHKYSHLSISITQPNQLHIITESEANFRLSNVPTSSSPLTSRSSNKEILDGIRGVGRTSTGSKPPRRVPKSPNQAVLDAMKGSQPQPTSRSYGSPAGKTSTKTSGRPAKTKDKCFIATAVYGPEALETKALRAWRDKALMPSLMGRIFVSCYYVLSPRFVPLLERSERLANIVKLVLDRLLIRIDISKNSDSEDSGI
jgi:serine/threonine protein kinase